MPFPLFPSLLLSPLDLFLVLNYVPLALLCSSLITMTTDCLLLCLTFCFIILPFFKPLLDVVQLDSQGLKSLKTMKKNNVFEILIGKGGIHAPRMRPALLKSRPDSVDVAWMVR